MTWKIKLCSLNCIASLHGHVCSTKPNPHTSHSWAEQRAKCTNNCKLNRIASRCWSCPWCWICGDRKLLQLLICIHLQRVFVCVWERATESFLCAPKQNKTHLALLAPRHASNPFHCLQIRVFQMNNTRQEMTNSRSDERFNMRESESKMGFISWMWRGFWSRLNRDSVIPSPPVVMQWTCSAQNQTGCIKTAALPQADYNNKRHKREVTAAHKPKRKKKKSQPSTSANMQVTKNGIYWRLFLSSCLFLQSSSQDFGGQTQFICTSVPKDMDICAATLQNSVPGEDLKSTVMQLRETVLQQKETIMNQKETIRELTSKLARCESQSGAEPGDARPGGRRKEAGTKNTMGDVSRGPADTLTQLSQTLQSLKQRLENLEVGLLLLKNSLHFGRKASSTKLQPLLSNMNLTKH